MNFVIHVFKSLHWLETVADAHMARPAAIQSHPLTLLKPLLWVVVGQFTLTRKGIASVRARIIQISTITLLICLSACKEQSVTKEVSCLPVIHMEIGEFASWEVDDGQQTRSISLEQVSDGRINVIADGDLIEFTLDKDAVCAQYKADTVFDAEVGYLISGEIPFDSIVQRVLGSNVSVQDNGQDYLAMPAVDQSVECEQVEGGEPASTCSGEFIHEAASLLWSQTLSVEDPRPGLGMTALTVLFQSSEVLNVRLDEWNGL